MAGKGKGKSSGSGDVQPIIVVKKVKKVSGGHHGGAWKVAYADFVTAMMSFFLLLWLLNVTTDEQKNAISNFFDPTHPMVSESTSGAGGVLGGTSIDPVGAMTTNVQNISVAHRSGATPKGSHVGTQGGKNVDIKNVSAKKLEKELRRRETARFEAAKEKLTQEIDQNPALSELKKHLMMDVTPEGLRIQIVDQQGEPMFPSGSSQMYDRTKKLLTLAASVIKKMPNLISVRGHTDATPYRPGSNYTNWELSADRANASRRILRDAGIPDSRLANVMGMADTDPLIPKQPTDARNRRITILLEREDLESMIDREGAAAAKAIDDPGAVDAARKELENAAKGPGYKQSAGDVYFP